MSEWLEAKNSACPKSQEIQTDEHGQITGVVIIFKKRPSPGSYAKFTFPDAETGEDLLACKVGLGIDAKCLSMKDDGLFFQRELKPTIGPLIKWLKCTFGVG